MQASITQPSPQFRTTEGKFSSIHAGIASFTMTWELWAEHLVSLQGAGSICKLTCSHWGVQYCAGWHQIIYWIPSISLPSLHPLITISAKPNQVRDAQTLEVLDKRKKPKLLGSWHRVTLTWGVISPNWMIICFLVAGASIAKSLWQHLQLEQERLLQALFCSVLGIQSVLVLWSSFHMHRSLLLMYLTTYKPPFKCLNHVQKTVLHDHFSRNRFITAHNSLGMSLGHFT